MQPKNFKDEILRKLDNSLTYMKRSVDYVKSHPKWSYVFKVMSDDDYSHAEQLYKMFLDLSLDIKDQEAYVNSIRDSLIEAFASKTRKIESYKVTYDLVIGSLDPPIKEEETSNGNITNE